MLTRIGKIAVYILVTLMTTSAAADFSHVSGPIESSFKRIQEQIAIRKAQRQQARQKRKSNRQIASVSFDSYMSGAAAEQSSVNPEQTAFKAKCGGHENVAEKLPVADIAVVGSPAPTVPAPTETVRGLASEEAGAGN